MQRVILLVMAALLVFAALACSSGVSQEEHEAAVEAARTEGFAAGQVEATEGMEAISSVGASLREFSLSSTPDNVPAGLVRFTAANGGPDDPHELVIFKTDLPIDELEQIAIANPDERGFLPEEGVAGVEFIGEIEEFDPGEVRGGVFELDAGNYVLICNIVEQEEVDEEGNPESHFLEGMSATFTAN